MPNFEHAPIYIHNVTAFQEYEVFRVSVKEGGWQGKGKERESAVGEWRIVNLTVMQ